MASPSRRARRLSCTTGWNPRCTAAPTRKSLPLLAEWSHLRCLPGRVLWQQNRSWRPGAARSAAFSVFTRAFQYFSAHVAEDPEECAKLAELESSFLGPFDPETESLEEYDARLDQGVEMARPDCKNEAISLAGCCLGSAVPDSLFAIYNSVPLNTSSCTPGRP